MDPNRSKYDLVLEFNDISFKIDRQQYCTFVSVFGALSRQMKAKAYRKFRPPLTITPKLDPKAWLKYAGSCILYEIHESRRKWEWTYFKTRRDERKRYIELYSKLKMNVITSEEVDELDELEIYLSFEDLRFYRLLARKTMKAPAANSTGKDKNSTWIGWITGSSPTKETEFSAQEQLKELYEAFSVNSYEDSRLDLPLNSVFLKLCCNISQGSITLKSHDLDGKEFCEIASSRFQNLELKVTQYPKTYQISVLIDDINVIEKSNSTFNEIISSKRIFSEKRYKIFLTIYRRFFCLQYDHLPLSGKSDDALTLKMLPLKVVILPSVLDQIVAFFKVERDELESISGLQAVVHDAMQGVTIQTRAGLEYAIEEHRVLEINVEIDAPIFLIPTAGPLLVVDAGHLNIKSELIDRNKKNEEEESYQHLLGLIYDKFIFNLTSLQVFIISGLEAYKDNMEIFGSNYLVENFDFSMCLEHCILPNAHEFPEFKISGKLPRFHMNLTHPNIKALQSVLQILHETFGPSDLIIEDKNTSYVKAFNDRRSSILSEDSDLAEFHDAVESPQDSSHSAIEEKQVSDRIKFVLNFQFEEASLSIYENQDVVMLAHFVAKGIRTSLTHRASESKLLATLTSLTFEDCKTKANEYRNLVGSEQNSLKTGCYSLVTFEALHKKLSNSNSASDTIIKLSLQPIRFIFARECMLRVYRFFSVTKMPLFNETPNLLSDSGKTKAKKPVNVEDTFSISVDLQRISVALVEYESSLCTLNLEGFSLESKTVGEVLSLSGNFGNIHISDDTGSGRDILKIEESKTAEFCFNSFSKSDEFPKDSLLKVTAASVRFFYYVSFIDRLTLYAKNLQEMQEIINSASQVAQDSAIQIHESVGKFQFDILIKTPIIEIPNPINDFDRIILHLGKINARSSIPDVRSTASLDNISHLVDEYRINISSLKLQSIFHEIQNSSKLELDVIEDITLDVCCQIFAGNDVQAPINQIIIDTNEVNCKLTDHQYICIMDIVRHLFAGSSVNSDIFKDDADRTITPKSVLRRISMAIRFPKIMLELYSKTKKMISPTEFSLARFISSAAHLKIDIQNDTTEAELKFRSLALHDTRCYLNNVFRDIMVPMTEVDDQFLMTCKLKPNSSDYLFTIDRAKLILEVDHIYAVRDFGLLPFATNSTQINQTIDRSNNEFTSKIVFVEPGILFLKLEIVLVRDIESSESDAVILKASQLTIANDCVSTVNFQKLGLFFCAMESRKQTELRFMDDSDLTVVNDYQESVDSINYYLFIDISKLLFRVSYQDLLLLSDLHERIFSSKENESITPVPDDNMASKRKITEKV